MQLQALGQRPGIHRRFGGACRRGVGRRSNHPPGLAAKMQLPSRAQGAQAALGQCPPTPVQLYYVCSLRLACRHTHLPLCVGAARSRCRRPAPLAHSRAPSRGRSCQKWPAGHVALEGVSHLAGSLNSLAQSRGSAAQLSALSAECYPAAFCALLSCQMCDQPGACSAGPGRRARTSAQPARDGNLGHSAVVRSAWSRAKLSGHGRHRL